jgi:hypothetical protein
VKDQIPQDRIPGLKIEVPAGAMAELCAAVAAETGIPEGRVRKVIQAAQRHQHTLVQGATAHPSTWQPSPPPGSLADQLRYYPIGPNGRLFPAIGTDPAGTRDPQQA